MSTSVTDLDVAYNLFSGPLPFTGIGYSLNNLYLRDNFYDGSVPSELYLLENIAILDIGQNLLTGTLPTVLVDVRLGVCASLFCCAVGECAYLNHYDFDFVAEIFSCSVVLGEQYEWEFD